MSRADFYAEMLEVRDRMQANHLALLEKLDGNHRELLAALERQGARVSALEAGFARLDERTGDENRGGQPRDTRNRVRTPKASAQPRVARTRYPGSPAGSGQP